MDKKTLIRNFSKAAHSYDQYADIQQQAAEELVSRIPKSGLKRVLEIGCGTGIYTRLLRERFRHTSLQALDISSEMVEVAKNKLRRTNITFVIADAEETLPEMRFDLITSNASFQWFVHLEKTLARLKGRLEKNGLLAFSLFGPKTFWELDEVLKKVSTNASVAAARFITCDKLQKLLKKYFKDVVVDEIRYSETFDHLADLLSKIKYTGTSGSGPAKQDFLGVKRLKDVERVFKEEFGGVRATHQVFFCSAKKP